MARTSTILLTALLLAASTAPVASAHIPNGSGPNVNYWITCGQTPSTWPGCAAGDALQWCEAECVNWVFVAVEIALHCFDHLRIDLEPCAEMPA